MTLEERQHIFQRAAEKVRNGQRAQMIQAEAKKKLAQNSVEAYRIIDGCAVDKPMFITPPHAQQQRWEPPMVVAPPLPVQRVCAEARSEARSKTRSEVPIAIKSCIKASVHKAVDGCADQVAVDKPMSTPNCKRLLGYTPNAIQLTATMDLSLVAPKVDTGLRIGTRRKNLTPETQLQKSKKPEQYETQTKRRLWIHKPGGGNGRVPLGRMPKGKKCSV